MNKTGREMNGKINRPSNKPMNPTRSKAISQVLTSLQAVYPQR
jgi:hypothetical protein